MMNLSMSGLPRQASAAIPTYAARFARKCLLERVCSNNHPVLAVEIQLVSEARASLHKALMSSRAWSRDAVKRQIRNHALEKAHSLIEDPTLLRAVVRAIQTASLDDAFPEVN